MAQKKILKNSVKGQKITEDKSRKGPQNMAPKSSKNKISHKNSNQDAESIKKLSSTHLRKKTVSKKGKKKPSSKPLVARTSKVKSDLKIVEALAKKPRPAIKSKKRADSENNVQSKALKKANSQKVFAKKAAKISRAADVLGEPKSIKSSLATLEPKILKNKQPVPESEAVRVLAEIVDTSLVPRGPTSLTPLGEGLSTYLANLNKYPLLTREQEEIIAKRYFEEKNPRDAEILVTSNLRFVVKVAAEYAKFGNRLLDVIQEGNVGLMHAVKEFNPYKGVRLITYAVWWIRGYIQEYLMRQHSMVRIGTTQNQRKLFYHLKKEKNMLDQLGQEPTVKLLATRLGVPEDDVRMMEERMSGGDLSLDAPVSSDNDTSRLQLEVGNEDLPIDDELSRRESLKILEDKIENLKPQLSDKEILILNERILADNPVTLQDIGEKWGVTREAVRQMEARLINKIKEEVLGDE